MSKNSEYYGYSSKNIADNYDDITSKEKDLVSDCGGIIDNRSKLGGNRAKFYTQDARDEFNKKMDKLKKQTENDESGSTEMNESIRNLIGLVREEIKKIKLEEQHKMKTYSVKQLKNIVRESAKNEFVPKLGDNVQKDNKTNNEKAYKDMQDATESYKGGMSKTKSFKLPNDDNRGMESLRVENPNKAYSDRIKAQLKGFPSADAEKIHGNEKLGNAEYGTDEITNQFKEKGENLAKGRSEATKIGLTGRELDKKKVDDLHKSLYAENTIKKLTFKNTEFLSEGHMLSKVPDLYMVEGNRFIMCDKCGKQYIVEWHNDTPDVKRKFTQENVNEEREKLMRLANYKGNEVTSTPSTRINENKEISDMLGKVRKLMK